MAETGGPIMNQKTLRLHHEFVPYFQAPSGAGRSVRETTGTVRRGAHGLPLELIIEMKHVKQDEAWGEEETERTRQRASGLVNV